MNRMKPLAAVLLSSVAMLAIGGCRSHTTIIEPQPQPQSQPRPDHHDDYHPPAPDRHDDHRDNHR